MENGERVTIRLPQQELSDLDTFVASGIFATRSEVIRAALRDYINSYMAKAIERTKQREEFKRLRAETIDLDDFVKK